MDDEIWFSTCTIDTYFILQVSVLILQVVYNANKLAKLVEKKKSLENWLTYYQNKYDRNPSKIPTIKVFSLKF